MNKEQVIRAYIVAAKFARVSNSIVDREVHRMKSSDTKHAAKILNSFCRYCINLKQCQ